MAKCEICGRSTAFGNNVSHSKRHTKRLFKPNLQKALIVQDGRTRHIITCTRCLKKLRTA